MMSAGARGKGGPQGEPTSGAPTPETIEVTTRRVMCDGGGGALGHPRVYYDLGETGVAECLYCDRRYVLAAGAGHDDH